MNEVLILSPNRPHSHVAIDYTGDATLYSSHEPISYCCVFLVLLSAAAAALGLLSYGGHSAER
jgi:tRNA(Arg) A34 adenosine deaminase TadA